MEAGLGLGNLVGGFVIGLLGPRLAKGRLVIVGYAAYGACIVGLGLTGNVAAALGLAVGIGVANMVFVIPSQTLFQQRTPGDMIGRVVGIRFSLVFASLSIAMAAERLPRQCVRRGDGAHRVRGLDGGRGPGRPARPGPARRLTVRFGTLRLGRPLGRPAREE